MLKCRVLHMHMIKVVEQNETIPKVPRWFGSPIHLYGGLLGIVALVAEFSIYFVCQRPQRIQQVKRRGVYAARRGSIHLYAGVLYAYGSGVLVPLWSGGDSGG